MNEITVRLAEAKDFDFIYATWLRSYRFSSQFAKKISNEVYFHWHHLVIDRIKERGGEFLIACPLDEPGVILGFMCTESVQDVKNVHFIYVKKQFRKMGVADALVDASRVDLDKVRFTHWTTDVDWMIKKFPKLTYDPYSI